MLAACALLAACGADPLTKPIDLYHGLEGGEIAAERPPPPGAGQPYPHIGTVPDRPVMPSQGFRTALHDRLQAERNQKELLAAAMPVEKVPPPPGPQRSPLKTQPGAAAGSSQGSAQAASQSGAPAGQGATASTPPDAPNSTADSSASNATIAAADAPDKPAGKSGGAGNAANTPSAPPHDAGLQIAGDPASIEGLPLVPDAPPPPAAIEGSLPAEPAPTPRLLPAPQPLPAGKPLYFANGSDMVQPSQRETITDINGHRGKKTIEVIGLGDADSDTPLGQEAAIDLGLRRARAIADVFLAMHVPASALRIAARPFGRGAIIRVMP